MMHHVDHRKLGRKTAHRRAMLSHIASSLVLHDQIETTLPKAKELRRIADHVVTLSKSGTLASRRRALALLRDPKAVEIAFRTLGTRFAKRNGGYTRIYRLGFRRGDSAPMALIEYLRDDLPAKEQSRASKGKKAKTKTSKKDETGEAKKMKKAGR